VTVVTAQTRLRETARAAGWLAEYEVRGFQWIADVLCTNGDALVALEDQLVDDRSLVKRTERYHRSGVRVVWFTPRLRRRTISRLIGVVPIFDAEEIEAVVPRVLFEYREPLPREVQSACRCELCGCPVSTIATFWCWNCWLRFTAPNSARVARPYRHLTEWNSKRERARQREERFAEIASAKRGLLEG
jgi:hypothetical protein